MSRRRSPVHLLQCASAAQQGAPVTTTGGLAQLQGSAGCLCTTAVRPGGASLPSHPPCTRLPTAARSPLGRCGCTGDRQLSGPSPATKRSASHEVAAGQSAQQPGAASAGALLWLSGAAHSGCGRPAAMPGQAHGAGEGGGFACAHHQVRGGWCRGGGVQPSGRAPAAVCWRVRAAAANCPISVGA